MLRHRSCPLPRTQHAAHAAARTVRLRATTRRATNMPDVVPICDMNVTFAVLRERIQTSARLYTVAFAAPERVGTIPRLPTARLLPSRGRERLLRYLLVSAFRDIPPVTAHLPRFPATPVRRVSGQFYHGTSPSWNCTVERAKTRRFRHAAETIGRNHLSRCAIAFTSAWTGTYTSVPDPVTFVGYEQTCALSRTRTAFGGYRCNWLRDRTPPLYYALPATFRRRCWNSAARNKRWFQTRHMPGTRAVWKTAGL